MEIYINFKSIQFIISFRFNNNVKKMTESIKVC